MIHKDAKLRRQSPTNMKKHIWSHLLVYIHIKRPSCRAKGNVQGTLGLSLGLSLIPEVAIDEWHSVLKVSII